MPKEIFGPTFPRPSHPPRLPPSPGGAHLIRWERHLNRCQEIDRTDKFELGGVPFPSLYFTCRRAHSFFSLSLTFPPLFVCFLFFFFYWERCQIPFRLVASASPIRWWSAEILFFFPPLARFSCIGPLFVFLEGLKAGPPPPLICYLDVSRTPSLFILVLMDLASCLSSFSHARVLKRFQPPLFGMSPPFFFFSFSGRIFS